MNARITEAQAMLQAGRRDEGLALMTAAMEQDPAQPADVWVALGRALLEARRFADGERLMAEACAQHPNDYLLRNLWGVMLRLQRRLPEALRELDHAIALDPEDTRARANRASVLLDMDDVAGAHDAFADLTRREPQSPIHRMQLGRTLARLGRRDEAAASFREAIALQPDYADGWRQLAALHDAAGEVAAAEAVLEEGLAAAPDHPWLLEAKVLLLRTSGQEAKAEAWLASLLPRCDRLAFVHMHLGDLISGRDRAMGNRHLRRAVELEPSLDHLALLAQSLARTFGLDEGASLDEALAICRRLAAAGSLSAGHTSIMAEVFMRVCAFDDVDALGDFRTLGRSWAESGRHTALFRQLARVRTMEDRFELLEQHRIWRSRQAARAAGEPIQRPAPRARDGRIRLGFMSSDLRRHPVGYFVLPLFDHPDRSRFDLYAYSYFSGPPDPLQERFGSQATAFRLMPGIGSRQAAQAIAEDQLDMLIELGGSTQMNKLEVMAWRPAPVQASWLGYPHSAGLEAIDYFICDRFTVPPDRRLLLEKPLLMPQSWIALGNAVFTDEHGIDPQSSEERLGRLTFGTANNTHKFTREALRLWARITAAVPNARFAFLRPEGASKAFRQHILAEFAAEGVDESRVAFFPVRGQHMPYYNEIDITLDAFPLTGGTTTVEALWMGVPVVSLNGPAFYERLSYSILANVGLGDLVADTPEDFARIALSLAADRERRTTLRRTLRGHMRQSPLGRGEDFARDFYDMIAGVVRP